MKYSGAIGFGGTYEIRPGVWTDNIQEMHFFGEVFKNTVRQEGSGQVNDNLNINNRISIVANPFALQNFHTIKYAIYMGTKWKVTNVEVEYPRLILTLGGVWNENDG